MRARFCSGKPELKTPLGRPRLRLEWVDLAGDRARLLAYYGLGSCDMRVTCRLAEELLAFKEGFYSLDAAVRASVAQGFVSVDFRMIHFQQRNGTPLCLLCYFFHVPYSCLNDLGAMSATHVKRVRRIAKSDIRFLLCVRPYVTIHIPLDGFSWNLRFFFDS
jgi:hypothetical protein